MRDVSIGEGTIPLICAPLVGTGEASLLAELGEILAKKPDVLEWRADFFAGLPDYRTVLHMARRIREAAPDSLAIFTIRSAAEGGQPSVLPKGGALELGAAICDSGLFDYVDCELSNEEGDILSLRRAARASGTRLIGSYHNFAETPGKDFLVGKMRRAEELGLDVAKVAVMPKSVEDVLTLLAATAEGKRLCSLPLIAMSMGGLGALTRMVGGVFGSALSFAVGRSASAPGQIPIEDLKTVLGIVEHAQGR